MFYSGISAAVAIGPIRISELLIIVVTDMQRWVPAGLTETHVTPRLIHAAFVALIHFFTIITKKICAVVLIGWFLLEKFFVVFR